MPLLHGSTTVKAMAAASAASTAFPPRWSIAMAGLHRERLRRGDGVPGKDRLAARRIGELPGETHRQAGVVVIDLRKGGAHTVIGVR